MIIKTDQAIIQSYLEDASGFTKGVAHQLVIPETEAELVAFIQQAGKQSEPVTISGGRTGVTAGCIALGGTLLSMEKFTVIEPIIKNKNDGEISIGPAIRLDTLKRIAMEAGYIYGPDPTERTGTLGGNTATNASGGQCFKYGPTRQHILGLRMVLTSGEIVDIRRGTLKANGDQLRIPLESGKELLFNRPLLPPLHVYKNAAGYFSESNMDPIDLLIGMDGTLGIITRLDIKLLPQPDGIFSLVIFYSDLKTAAEHATIIRQSTSGKNPLPGITPASLEVMDQHALNLLRPNFPNIPSQAGAVLMIEQDYTGNDDEALALWSNYLDQHDIPDHMIWLAEDSKSREQIRLFRHALPEAVNDIVRKRHMPKVGTDMAVPIETFDSMLDIYTSKLEQLNQEHLIFGHIGECHLHVNVLPKNQEEYDAAKKLYLQFAEEVVKRGGTVSAEHGIGKIKHDFLKIMVGETGFLEMARVKKIFDPARILNRNNIFPETYLNT